MISARPPETASRVEKRWYTRTGSSVLRTVTAVPSRMRLVRDAIAPRRTSGALIREVGTVVLADAEKVDADPIGQLGLGDDVTEDLGLRLGPAVLVRGDVTEGVDTQFNGWHGWHGGITATEGGGFPAQRGPSTALDHVSRVDTHAAALATGPADAGEVPDGVGSEAEVEKTYCPNPTRSTSR